MTIALPMNEPKTAEYLYIAPDNRVHLMMPIVGGDTVGIDNTCQTMKEIQAFFYGCRDPLMPSAPAVLEAYKTALQCDIQFLIACGKMPEVLASKRHRLQQIEGYIAILSEVRNTFVPTDVGFPPYPDAVATLLGKKTNCLSMHLSPTHAHHYLKTKAAFSLTRTREVRDAEGFLIQQPVDAYVGLGPKLRQTLSAALRIPRAGVVPLKTQLMSEAVAHFRERPTLEALQAFLENKIALRTRQQVNLRVAQDTTEVNAAYFEVVTLERYDESSVAGAVETILNACLAEEFWTQAEQTSVLTIDNSLVTDVSARAKEVERLTIATQFFLAQINIYCIAHRLSTNNFGPVFEANTYLELVATRVKDALLNNRSVEAALFDLVDQLRPTLGINRVLTETEKRQITETFTIQFNTIKNSPHMDEFIVFLPEVRGDFFNHRSRISVHFLDFITQPGLGMSRQRRIDQSIRASGLSEHVRVLKAGVERRLNHQNPVFTSTFQDFLDLISPTSYEWYATCICSNILNPSSLVELLTLEQLDALLNHPQWPGIEASLVTMGGRYQAAIRVAREALGFLYEKTFCMPDGHVNSAPILNDQNWRAVTQGLESFVVAYKSKWFYSWKNEKRKAQIGNLENALLNLQASVVNGLPARISVLAYALKTFDIIIQEIGAEPPSRYKTSGLQEGIMAIKEHFLTTFSLHGTPVAINSLTAVQGLVDAENVLLGALSAYPVLHGLKAEWWTGAALANVKALPAACYTRAMVTFLNSITPAALDSFVLKALQVDQLHAMLDSVEVLRLRGQFLTQLGDEPQYSFLRKLPQNWWREYPSIDRIKTFLPANLSPGLIRFLTSIGPRALDADLSKVLQREAVNFEDHADNNLLRARGRYLSYVEEREVSEPFKASLLGLGRAWWEYGYHNTNKLLSLPSLPVTVITFLNKVSTWSVDDNVLRGLHRRILDNSVDERFLNLELLRREGALIHVKQQARQAQVTRQAGLPQITAAVRSSRISLTQSIASVKSDYAVYVGQKWWDYKNRSHSKNELSQTELTRAMEGLNSDVADSLYQVRAIIVAAKTNLERDYGTRSWSWCLFRMQYSSRLLNQLIAAIDQVTPQPLSYAAR